MVMGREDTLDELYHVWSVQGVDGERAVALLTELLASDDDVRRSYLGEEFRLD